MRGEEEANGGRHGIHYSYRKEKWESKREKREREEGEKKKHRRLSQKGRRGLGFATRAYTENEERRVISV